MSIEISQLEQAWLKAETAADEVKQEAMRLTAELAKRRPSRGEDGQDYKALVLSIEKLKSRQEEAERTASAAFDRYWSAQNMGRGGSGSAYA